MCAIKKKMWRDTKIASVVIGAEMYSDKIGDIHIMIELFWD
jgi:hypothetical protein